MQNLVQSVVVRAALFASTAGGVFGAAPAAAGNDCGIVTAPLPASRTYAVRGPGFQYTLNGVADNPTIELAPGMLYRFQVQTEGFHPFALSTSWFQVIDPPGVSPNNDTSNGVITYTPSAASGPRISYTCSIHFFCGTVIISTDLFFHDSAED